MSALNEAHGYCALVRRQFEGGDKEHKITKARCSDIVPDQLQFLTDHHCIDWQTVSCFARSFGHFARKLTDD